MIYEPLPAATPYTCELTLNCANQILEELNAYGPMTKEQLQNALMMQVVGITAKNLNRYWLKAINYLFDNCSLTCERNEQGLTGYYEIA